MPRGEEFVVLGASGYGALSSATRGLLGRVARASHGSIDGRQLCATFSTCVTMLTGHVLHAAERRAGVMHQVSLFSSSVASSQANNTPSGRDDISSAAAATRAA